MQLKKGTMYRYHEVPGWDHAMIDEGDVLVLTGFGGGQPYRLGVLEGEHQGKLVWHFGEGLEEIGADPKAMEHILAFEAQYQARVEARQQEYEARTAGATNAFDRIYGIGAKDTIEQAGREFVELLQKPRMRPIKEKFLAAGDVSLHKFETDILNSHERALWRAAGNQIDKKYGFSGATFSAMTKRGVSIHAVR